jgi:hypothetical protein
MASPKSNTSDEVDESPPKTLREEALEVVTEWRDELAAKYNENASEVLAAELYLINQIMALLEPTATHYQT